MDLKREGFDASRSNGHDADWQRRQEDFLRLLEPALAPLSRFCRAMCRDTRTGARFSFGRTNGREESSREESSGYGGCDEERAKDLIGDTILKAFEHFDRLLDHQAFLSYLFTIAVRTNRRDRMRLTRWQPFERRHEEELVSPMTAPDANADVEALYDALAKLPQSQREAIVLAEIVGMKLEEVAEIQEASLSAVKSRVSRGKMKLQELLGVLGGAKSSEETKSSEHAKSSDEARSSDQAQSAAQRRIAPGIGTASASAPSAAAPSAPQNPASTQQYRFAFQAKNTL